MIGTTANIMAFLIDLTMSLLDKWLHYLIKTLIHIQLKVDSELAIVHSSDVIIIQPQSIHILQI